MCKKIQKRSLYPHDNYLWSFFYSVHILNLFKHEKHTQHNTKHIFMLSSKVNHYPQFCTISPACFYSDIK